MGVKEEQKEETSPTSTCGLAPSRLPGRLVMRVKRHARSEGWKSLRCVSKATPARPYACRCAGARHVLPSYETITLPLTIEPLPLSRSVLRTGKRVLASSLVILRQLFQPFH